MPDTTWTFAQIKERGLQLEGQCMNADCRRFYVFDLDALIAHGGPNYPLPETIPGMICESCGGELKSQLAVLDFEPEADPA